MTHRTARSPRRTRGAVIGIACAVSLTVTSVPTAFGAGVPEPQVTAAASAPAVVGLTITRARELLTNGETTSVDLVKAYVARINAYDDPYGDQPGVNAVLRINAEALAQAAALDAERAAGRIRGPLHGVPILVKDNYDTAGMPTTSGSAALSSFQPADDATMVARLRDAGAIVLAKTNLHEFAFGITTISSVGGQTRNPYDQQRNPGGSSGGTGAGLGADFAVAGLGTDTCGSIRIPAAHQNLVGLRPTLGLTSRDGIAPMSHTQDVGGPIARSVADVAVMMDAVVGADPRDASTAASVGRVPATYTASLNGGLRGKRIGLLSDGDYLGTTPAEQPTTDVVRWAAEELRAAGAEVVEVSLPTAFSTALSGAGVIVPEFRDDLNAYLAQHGATYDPAIAALTAPAATLTLSDIIASYTAISGVQGGIAAAESYDDATASPTHAERMVDRATAQTLLAGFFADQGVDAVAYPTIRQTAQRIGQGQAGSNCALSAQTGFPALTMPAGFSAEGMPVGLEFLGLPWSEPTLLEIGAGFEKAGAHQRPAASTPELAKAAVTAVGLDAAAGSTTYGSPTTLTIGVTSPIPARGRVTVSYGGREVAAAEVRGTRPTSTVTATVPAGILPVGAQTLGLRFTPGIGNATGGATGFALVSIGNRGVEAPRLRVTRRPTSTRNGRAVIRFSSPGGLSSVTGAATLTLVHGTKRTSLALAVVDGKAKVRLPRLAKGKWQARLAFRGSENYSAATFRLGRVRSKR